MFPETAGTTRVAASHPSEWRVPFNKPAVGGSELANVAAAVRSGALAGNGAFASLCREWLSAHHGGGQTFMTPSCTAALELAALLCDLEAGDEVIMPSYTFVTTASAFALRGAVPVFVDIRPDTLNVDEPWLRKQ